MITVYYFASIRETLNQESEAIAVSDDMHTVEDLINALINLHGELWMKTLRESSVLVAVNQQVSKVSAAISDGDEVAFFPPVTGG
ncbi:molybdopterin converting factor subunit 1 [Gammaproteobacteria bacterium]|nr:molybdopterin converting factor subunit 1 [Gammaproteobacteria bacterium]